MRAASALIAVARGHLVVQDDALFLATLGDGSVGARSLPAVGGVRQFDDLRGNKADKPDLEAGCLWSSGGSTSVVAFGSGSTALRERVLVVERGGRGAPRWVEARALYAALRLAVEGGELNIEGAFPTEDGHLRLLQRGNGRGGLNATVDVHGAWMNALVAGGQVDPVVRVVTRWQLGELDGVALSFTDGLAMQGGRWLFSAAAEESPDAVADGPVAGSVVGWADGEGGQWARLVDPGGQPVACKLEGLAAAPDGGLLGVVDADDPRLPSELLQLALVGPWPALGGLRSW